MAGSLTDRQERIAVDGRQALGTTAKRDDAARLRLTVGHTEAGFVVLLLHGNVHLHVPLGETGQRVGCQPVSLASEHMTIVVLQFALHVILGSHLVGPAVHDGLIAVATVDVPLFLFGLIALFVVNVDVWFLRTTGQRHHQHHA